jgi:hypothetical protein
MQWRRVDWYDFTNVLEVCTTSIIVFQVLFPSGFLTELSEAYCRAVYYLKK